MLPSETTDICFVGERLPIYNLGSEALP